MKPKLTIICPYPRNKVGSQRFRFEQYIPFLENEFDIIQLPFWSEKANTILYKKGFWFQKSFELFKSCVFRFFHLFTIIQSDIVFIHRESIPIGGHFYEYIIVKWLKKKLIFDFDDAIWNLDSSQENEKVAWMKKPEKTKHIISLSKLVFAGNQYLANYALQFNSHVLIIPTTIDLNYHQKTKKSNYQICIGWTGSKTTIPHFELITPILLELKTKYGDQLCFKVIGDEDYLNEDLNIKGVKWSLATEIDELNSIDIGIMPLPEDEWTKGKCGFKGLQYMSLSIATILSPVGVNTEIIEDGVNGYLAQSHKEWIDKISKLIDSKTLRDSFGEKGYETIQKKYSVEANKQKYLDAFNSLLS